MTESGTKPQAAPKHGRKLVLLIILVPIVIALAGGTLLYLWSKKKAQSQPTVQQIKADK